MHAKCTLSAPKNPVNLAGFFCKKWFQFYFFCIFVRNKISVIKMEMF